MNAAVGLVAAAGAVILTDRAANAPSPRRPRLRAVGPGDLPALERFVAGLSRATRTQRFFAPLPRLPSVLEQAIADGDPRQRFVAAISGGDVVALGQSARVDDRPGCELAFVVADDWQRRGIGTRLMAWLIGEAELAGLGEARLETQRDNLAMQALALQSGFLFERHPDEPGVLLGRRALADRSAAWWGGRWLPLPRRVATDRPV